MKVIHGDCITVEKISEMYHYNQLTIKQLGKMYNMSETTMYRFFKKNNIKIRSKSDAVNLSKVYRKKTRKINYKLKTILKCSNCVYIFKNELKDSVMVKCPKCNNMIDSRVRKWKKDSKKLNKLKKYYKENYELVKQKAREGRWKFRLSVLNIVGKGVLKCVNCGCDNTKLLEINHKNGNGIKETKQGTKFYYTIRNLERNIDDLELTCRICNTLHYMELLHGKLPYKIIWNEKHV